MSPRNRRIGDISSATAGRLMTILVVFAVTAMGVLMAVYGERIPVHGGFGWDGEVYHDMTVNFPRELFDYSLIQYYAGRLLPAALVSSGLRLVARKPDAAAVILGFRIATLLLYLGDVALWAAILRRSVVRVSAVWFGFVALFVCFAVGKLPFYYPVLTDQFAFFLGVLGLYAYVSGRGRLLLLAAALGIFTWPAFAPFAFALYLLPVRPAGSIKVSGPASRMGAIGLGAAIAVGLAYVAIRLNQRGAGVATPTVAPLVWVSVLGMASYLFFALRELFDPRVVWSPHAWWDSLAKARIAPALAVYLGCSIFLAWIAQPTPPELGGLAFLKHFTTSAIVAPGVFIVAHVTFFGPVVIVAGLWWRSMARDAVHSYGLGALVGLVVLVCMGIASQSRFLTPMWPLLVLLATRAWDRSTWNGRHFAVFTLMAVAFSKVWLQINARPWPDDLALTSYPAQLFFMNIGPWMSHETYVLQGAVVVMSAAALLLMAWWSNRSPAGGPDQRRSAV